MLLTKRRYYEKWTSCLRIVNERPRRRGGGVMRPHPHEFFWNGFRTAGRPALNFCTAYEVSFAQLLAKNDRVRSGHGAMTA